VRFETTPLHEARKQNKFIMKDLIRFLLPYKFKIIIVLIALMVTSSSVLVLGYGLKSLIDNGFANSNIENLKYIFSFFIIVIVTLSTASYIRASTIYVVCESAEADIRKAVYNHIIGLSPEFFEINKTSDIISRLTVDTSVLNSIIANLLSFLIRNVLMLIGGLVMLFLINPKLSMIVIAILPVIVLPILYLSKKIRFLSRKSQDMIALLSAHIEETLNGIKTVQAFNLENYERNVFSQLVQDTLSVSKKRYKFRAILVSLAISLSLLSVTLVLWVGSNDVVTGKITIGTLSSFIFYAIIVASSIGGIGEVLGELQRAAAANDRIFELLQLKSTISSPEPIKIPHNLAMNLEFKDLSFSYPSRKNSLVLDKINFSINESETIALVGPSGSGKTTILNLLLRFYNFSEGTIKIGGIDIREFNLTQLRNFFALVPQEPVIFSASALDNIKYGNPDASLPEVIEASKAAEIHEFLQSLPNGYDTFLGEKGIRISGGQRQRIAIARAILKNPQILLLDEATSSLDNENERLVKLALERLKKGRTTIMIAHRFSTIANADRIILLNDAKIDSIGTYKDLLKYSELFQKLANEQVKG